MTKKEILWRHILIEAMDKHALIFTQKSLAEQFDISTSTVFNALKAPRKLGAIEVTGRFFKVRSAEKLLLLWATQRNIKKDFIYSTRVDAPVGEIEGKMPPNVIFGAFSAYRLKYQTAPADYSVVYIYSEDLEPIQKRFPLKKGNPNLFVMKPDSYLSDFGKTTPDAQTFVDLWNIPEWYAKDFLDAIKKKMNF